MTEDVCYQCRVNFNFFFIVATEKIVKRKKKKKMRHPMDRRRFRWGAFVKWSCIADSTWCGCVPLFCGFKIRSFVVLFVMLRHECKVWLLEFELLNLLLWYYLDTSIRQPIHGPHPIIIGCSSTSLIFFHHFHFGWVRYY